MNAIGDPRQTAPIADPAADKLDRKLLLVALVVVLGAFPSILDTTIVNVALKHLSRTFGVALETIQWVSTGYMLALAMVIPLTGWAADRFGAKRLFMTSIVLFLTGSALAGAAWSAPSLIVFRVVQGLGGGMIMPAAMTILGQAAGPRRMGRMLGITGVPMLLAPIFGPIVGGWLVDDVSWRWIFFANLPIGAMALVACARILAPSQPAPHHAVDWRGVALLSPGLAIFVFGLARVAAAGDMNGLPRALCVVGGLTLVALFALHALRRDAPLIDVRLFARRAIAASALTTFLFGMAFYGMSLLMPLYFQLVRGQTAFDAGLLLAVQGAGAMMALPVAVVLTDRIGAGKVVLVGLCVVAFGVLGLTTIGGTTPFWHIELALFVLGLGGGATMMPTMSAGIGALQPHEIARGNSGLTVVQRVGGSIGTAVLAVVLAHRMARVGASLGIGPSHPPTPADATAMLAGFGHAFAHTFQWALVMILLSFCAAIFLPRTKAAKAPASVGTPLLVD